MTKAIWKYPLETTDEQVVEMPIGASILCCQVQQKIPCLWALVDTTVIKKVGRTIITRETGHPCDGIGPENYIGTYQLHGGSLMFHVFTTSPKLGRITESVVQTPMEGSTQMKRRPPASGI